MTSPSPDPRVLHASIAAIDETHPLKVPLHYNQGHISPRLDRLEAKTAYLVDYIAYLEQRLTALESRPTAAPGAP
ncbi:hypothetical protein SCB71_03940 [Herbiconiux sp. KACC 21604]|uniref:hypothetical protein n=1 Tax=unclassified Herbiconiux TaxID=2618217 RepID=UPI0014916750|nr:hypothetical protein [Herbiconiux sp. SALV-R1]QJU52525.1 hypothetical protein HL652_01905 [Herbiconiux sp. SALV-R1]WPO87401.1 hypothetical protein SCB71_03940 [Herbiconiux sp. KACC 21604]